MNILNIYIATTQYQDAQNCDSKLEKCPQLRSALSLTANVVQLVFWCVAIAVVTRFYLRFREKYDSWKASYKTAHGPDSQFQHWVYRNNIVETQTNAYALDSLS
jgi:hypothetical protein